MMKFWTYSLALVVGPANCVQPGSHIRSDIPVIRQAPISHSIESDAHALVQQKARAQLKERDIRPGIVSYDDKNCSSELGGIFLPADSDLSGGCTRVAPRYDYNRMGVNLTSRWSGAKMVGSGSNNSMSFKCGANRDGAPNMEFTLFFGSNCTGGKDDAMRLIIKADDFGAFRNGECIPAFSNESVETEYVKVLNPDSVTAWPECIGPGIAKSIMWIIVIGISVAVIVIGCAIAACLLLSKSPKKLLEEQEVTAEAKEAAEDESTEKS